MEINNIKITYETTQIKNLKIDNFLLLRHIT
jgi:hypothetical protein